MTTAVDRVLSSHGIGPDDVPAWSAFVAMPFVDVARRGLAGDRVARIVAHLPAAARWLEIVGDDDPPLDVVLFDLRRARRRAVLHGHGRGR
jgi:hypothetical protein